MDWGGGGRWRRTRATPARIPPPKGGCWWWCWVVVFPAPRALPVDVEDDDDDNSSSDGTTTDDTAVDGPATDDPSADDPADDEPPPCNSRGLPRFGDVLARASEWARENLPASKSAKKAAWTALPDSRLDALGPDYQPRAVHQSKHRQSRSRISPGLLRGREGFFSLPLSSGFTLSSSSLPQSSSLFLLSWLSWVRGVIRPCVIVIRISDRKAGRTTARATAQNRVRIQHGANSE